MSSSGGSDGNRRGTISSFFQRSNAKKRKAAENNLGNRTGWKKEIVVDLMKPVNELDDNNKVLYIKCLCPNEGCWLPDRIYQVKPTNGFTNAYSHLESCVAKGVPKEDKKAYISALHEDAKKKATEEGGTILSHWEVRTNRISTKKCRSIARDSSFCAHYVVLIEKQKRIIENELALAKYGRFVATGTAPSTLVLTTY